MCSVISIYNNFHLKKERSVLYCFVLSISGTMGKVLVHAAHNTPVQPVLKTYMQELSIMDAVIFSLFFWKLEKSVIKFMVSPEEGSSLPPKPVILF